jgi:hypothetical protein
VAADERPLVVGERAGLEQQRARDRDLAEVVQLGRGRQALDGLLVEAELARHVEPRHPAAGEQHDRRVRERVEAEPQPVGDRRERCLLEVGEHDRPVPVAARVDRQPNRDQPPREPLLRAHDGADADQHRGAEQHAVVERLHQRRFDGLLRPGAEDHRQLQGDAEQQQHGPRARA